MERQPAVAVSSTTRPTQDWKREKEGGSGSAESRYCFLEELASYSSNFFSLRSRHTTLHNSASDGIHSVLYEAVLKLNRGYSQLGMPSRYHPTQQVTSGMAEAEEGKRQKDG